MNKVGGKTKIRMGISVSERSMISDLDYKTYWHIMNVFKPEDLKKAIAIDRIGKTKCKYNACRLKTNKGDVCWLHHVKAE